MFTSKMTQALINQTNKQNKLDLLHSAHTKLVLHHLSIADSWQPQSDRKQIRRSSFPLVLCQAVNFSSVSSMPNAWRLGCVFEGFLSSVSPANCSDVLFIKQSKLRNIYLTMECLCTVDEVWRSSA